MGRVQAGSWEKLSGTDKKIPWIACFERLWFASTQRAVWVAQDVEKRCQNLGIANETPQYTGCFWLVNTLVAGTRPF